jgi:hypothetical protein
VARSAEYGQRSSGLVLVELELHEDPEVCDQAGMCRIRSRARSAA